MADIAKTGFTRVFLIEGGARPDHAPIYQSYMRAGSPSKGYGDLTTIEGPSNVQYDQFTELDVVKGAEERATMDLIGRYLADTASDMLRIAEIGCGADIQVHIGKCTDPTVFNTFTKSFVMENAYFSNWSADDLGALESGDRNPVNETGSISAKTIYEILPLTLAEVAGSVVTNEVLAITICDQVACGDCDEDSGGCEHIYAVTKQAGGSPGTPPDIVFTVDGSTWYADDIDSIGAAEDPSDIMCVGDYIVVVSNDSGSAHYAEIDYVNDVDYDETWTEIATGFTGAPNACYKAVGGRYGYIVGDSGYIYRTDDITAGVTVLDAGSAVSDNLNDVHMMDDNYGVAVGDAGAVVYTENGITWASVAGPVATNLSCCWMKSESVWMVGTEAGTLYYTVDKGSTWTIKGFPGSGSGVTHDIYFAADAVGYLAHETAAGAGRILRTFDGGYSWTVLPEGSGTIPANDKINAVVGCIYDRNIVFGVGLGDDGADGIIVRGSD